MAIHDERHSHGVDVAYLDSLLEERRKLAKIREYVQPAIKEAFWKVDGQIVTTANIGVEVEAHVVLKAIEECPGSIRVRIRKDVALRPEKDCCVSNVPVNFIEGQEKEIELTFIPDEPSGNSLRGYFIEVDFLTTKTKWVMENSYPPRLRVT